MTVAGEAFSPYGVSPSVGVELSVFVLRIEGNGGSAVAQDRSSHRLSARLLLHTAISLSKT